MASERAIRRAVGQAAVLAAGAATAWAATQGMYASALTAVLAGAVLAIAQLEDGAPIRSRFMASTTSAPNWDVPVLRALLNEAPAPLLLLEPEGRVRAVNRAARVLFDTDDQVARPPTELLSALREEPAGGRRRLALTGEDGLGRIYTLSLADVETSNAALRLGALLDVQAEIHQAEAETLRSVLQVVSHELMNSLTPVTSLADTAADLLADEPDASAVAAARAALATIGRRADGLARFVTGYRAMARLPEPRLRSVDVAQLAEDVVLLVRALPDAQTVNVALDRPSGPVVRVTDPDLVGQALTNLIINALEAAVANRERPATLHVVIAPVPGGARFEISDSGSGVPASEAQAIFLPMTTGKSGGTGVGLYLARAAMRSLGGEVLMVEQTAPHAQTRFDLLL